MQESSLTLFPDTFWLINIPKYFMTTPFGITAYVYLYT